MGYIAELSKSSVLTGDEKAWMAKRTANGMTAAEASKAIEWLTTTIAEREQEAQGT